VFNESGIDDTFHIRLNWKQGNLASLQEAVKQQLGLPPLISVRSAPPDS
jgi:hypothetical protein